MVKEYLKTYPFTEIQKKALSLFGDDDTCSCTATAFRIHGILDTSRLESAIQDTIHENEVFRWELLRRGKEIVSQGVLEARDFHLEVIKADGTSDGEKEQFIIATGKQILDDASKLDDPLLYRFVVFEISKEEHIFLMAFNHILTDGIANSLVMMSIIMKYNGIPLHNDSKCYMDFLVNEDRYLHSEEGKRQIESWKELTKDYHMNHISLTKENREKSQIRQVTTLKLKAIRDIAIKNKTSVFVVNLFLLHLALASIYSVDDMVINVMEGNRAKEYRNTIGLLSYSYATRMRFDKHKTTTELLAEFIQRYNTKKDTRLSYCAPNDSPIYVVYQNYNSKQKLLLGSASMEPYNRIYEERINDNVVFVGTETPEEINFSFVGDYVIFPDSFLTMVAEYFQAGLEKLGNEIY